MFHTWRMCFHWILMCQSSACFPKIEFGEAVWGFHTFLFTFHWARKAPWDLRSSRESWLTRHREPLMTKSNTTQILQLFPYQTYTRLSCGDEEAVRVRIKFLSDDPVVKPVKNHVRQLFSLPLCHRYELFSRFSNCGRREVNKGLYRCQLTDIQTCLSAALCSASCLQRGTNINLTSFCKANNPLSPYQEYALCI